MSFLKCEKCERPATHKFTRIVEGHALDFYFCQQHAAEFSPLQLKSGLNAMELTQLLAGLLKSEHGKKVAAEPEGPDVKCRTCGQSLGQYRQTMLLGCSDCYQTFEKFLAEDLRRYHGTTRHCGKQLVGAIAGEFAANEEIESLKIRLATAIQDEDFELAAQLRDQIRLLTTSSRTG